MVLVRFDSCPALCSMVLLIENNMESEMKSNKKCEICLENNVSFQIVYEDRTGHIRLPIVCGKCSDLDDDEINEIIEDGVNAVAVWKGDNK